MLFPYLDASAAAKRYTPEVGSDVVDHLFGRVPADRIIVLSVGLTEVASILTRKRNVGAIPTAKLLQIISDVRAEIGPTSAVRLVEVNGILADRAFDLVLRHSVNSTDAILLRSALDLAAPLRAVGDDLLLVASDQRLLRAGQAEGLTVFNPEVQTDTDLDALLGP
jgi:predicted nucleic acid-binding protein